VGGARARGSEGLAERRTGPHPAGASRSRSQRRERRRGCGRSRAIGRHRPPPVRRHPSTSGGRDPLVAASDLECPANGAVATVARPRRGRDRRRAGRAVHPRICPPPAPPGVRGVGQGSRASSSRRARNARPRWLMRSFSSGGSSAMVSSHPAGTKMGS